MSTNNWKKTEVTWGSNVIGLAKDIKPVSDGHFVDIQDSEEPVEGILPAGSYEYTFCDFLIFRMRNIA